MKELNFKKEILFSVLCGLLWTVFSIVFVIIAFLNSGKIERNFFIEGLGFTILASHAFLDYFYLTIFGTMFTLLTTLVVTSFVVLCLLRVTRKFFSSSKKIFMLLLFLVIVPLPILLAYGLDSYTKERNQKIIAELTNSYKIENKVEINCNITCSRDEYALIVSEHNPFDMMSMFQAKMERDHWKSVKVYEYKYPQAEQYGYKYPSDYKVRAVRPFLLMRTAVVITIKKQKFGNGSETKIRVRNLRVL